jgi:hypothetical protein
MFTHLQLTIDCRDPHPLAEWWAQALGWAVEPQDADFIRSMVDQGLATDDQTTTHRGALVWRVGAAIVPPTEGSEPDLRRMLFQQVPEGKSVKNRVHLDIRIGPDRSVEDEVARLVASGASVLHEGQQGPSVWTTMADPEGNEFCVSP